ncbi:MAG: hypothetical protein WC856_08525 [Methylococcaceae bacterium]
MYKNRVEKEILQQLRRIYLVMLEALNHGLQHESKIALTLFLLTFFKSGIDEMESGCYLLKLFSLIFIKKMI